MSRAKTLRVLAGAAALFAFSFGRAQAQSVENEDVVIMNDHLHVHEVFVVDAHGERHVLGFVGHDQLKAFDVPAKYEAMGPYRIALQQYMPEPGLGVSAAALPYKLTPVLEVGPGDTVSIIVGNDTQLSSVDVVTNTRQQQQR